MRVAIFNLNIMAGKIKHVYGNILRVTIPLTQRTTTFVDKEIVEQTSDFFPNLDYPVKITLYKGGGLTKKVFEASVVGNKASFYDDGSLPIGNYQIEVLCRDDNGSPMRFMQRDVIEIVDATQDAGLPVDVEFDLEAKTLDAAVFYNTNTAAPLLAQLVIGRGNVDTFDRTYIKLSRALRQDEYVMFFRNFRSTHAHGARLNIKRGWHGYLSKNAKSIRDTIVFASTPLRNFNTENFYELFYTYEEKGANPEDNIPIGEGLVQLFARPIDDDIWFSFDGRYRYFRSFLKIPPERQRQRFASYITERCAFGICNAKGELISNLMRCRIKMRSNKELAILPEKVIEDLHGITLFDRLVITPL